MANCPHCGGIIGRDCFNVEECGEITRAVQFGPGADRDLENDLRMEIVQLRTCMEKAKKILEVPAAQYVPALNDAWEEPQRGLSA